MLVETSPTVFLRSQTQNNNGFQVREESSDSSVSDEMTHFEEALSKSFSNTLKTEKLSSNMETISEAASEHDSINSYGNSSPARVKD